MPQSLLVRHIRPPSRPIWQRRFLTVFFTLVVVIHLTAISGFARSKPAGVTFNLLTLAAAASAAAAVTLRQESGPERAPRPSLQKNGVWTEQSLAREVRKALEQATKQRLSLGMMLISVEAPLRVWDDSSDIMRRALAVVRNILLSRAGKNDSVFTLRSGRIAFLTAADRAVPRLESVADHLQWDARAEFTRVAALAACTLTFGLTEADAVKSSADEVFRNAELALRRATTLRTGRYVVSPRNF